MATSSVGSPAPAALGIDVGGTGIKAAAVDVATGELLSARVRISTPQPSTPEEVAATIGEVVDRVVADYALAADAPVGCGLPCVIVAGTVRTAANLSKKWVGISPGDVIGRALERRVHVINDADAAGLAEMHFGAGRDCAGTVLVLTIGTGIGSALFVDGRLVPNTEFGHLEFKGKDAERLVSGVARERRKLSWREWADEFNEYLARVELYVSPDLIILGGGVSKSMSKYDQWLTTRAPLVVARHLNTSGIIGAAMSAATEQAAR